MVPAGTASRRIFQREGTGLIGREGGERTGELQEPRRRPALGDQPEGRLGHGIFSRELLEHRSVEAEDVHLALRGDDGVGVPLRLEQGPFPVEFAGTECGEGDRAVGTRRGHFGLPGHDHEPAGAGRRVRHQAARGVALLAESRDQVRQRFDRERRERMQLAQEGDPSLEFSRLDRRVPRPRWCVRYTRRGRRPQKVRLRSERRQFA